MLFDMSNHHISQLWSSKKVSKISNMNQPEAPMQGRFRSSLICLISVQDLHQLFAAGLRGPIDFLWTSHFLEPLVRENFLCTKKQINIYINIYIYIYISQCLQCLALAVELWCWSIHFLAKSLIHHLESHGPKPPIRLGGPPAGLMISDGWPNRTPMPPGLRTRELRHSVKTHQKQGVNPVIQTPVREIWVNIVEE